MKRAESWRTDGEIEKDDKLLASDVPGSVEWLLLTGSRWVVSGCLVFLFLLVLLNFLELGIIATGNESSLTAVFSAYVLRIATITRRTGAVLPSVMPA